MSAKCFKVEPKEHLSAYLEGRDLIRDAHEIDCDRGLLENITCNYIIVKTILSHLSWQDQLICKSVCKIWCDAVKALQREILSPQDFVVDVVEVPDDLETAALKKSGSLPTEPLAIFTFTNFTGFCKMGICSGIVPCPCEPPCSEVHWWLDCVDHELCYPKECNLVVRASYLNYMPLPTSVTSLQTINGKMLAAPAPLLCGLYVPKIPEIQYEILNINAYSDMRKEFYDIVDKMAETKIFKGFLVFVTDKYFLNTMDDSHIEFLNHFSKIQPDIPYALGGCIVEDAVNDRCDLQRFISNVNAENTAQRKEYSSDNQISLAVFSVPKESCQSGATHRNFEMFSLILESSDWSKPNIQKAVKDFSDAVPRFEHTAAIKLSCVGRISRHDLEQRTFRQAFPHTPIVGCYGNGELGVNHPPRPEPRAPLSVAAAKRLKKNSAEYGVMYSYSTVFVYMGWGKSSTRT